MLKFKKGDKVKIVRHPTKSHYCGLEGKISDMHEGLGPNTRGVADGSKIPQPGKQWKYDVQIDCPPSDFVLRDLEEDWLELL